MQGPGMHLTAEQLAGGWTRIQEMMAKGVSLFEAGGTGSHSDVIPFWYLHMSKAVFWNNCHNASSQQWSWWWLISGGHVINDGVGMAIIWLGGWRWAEASGHDTVGPKQFVHFCLLMGCYWCNIGCWVIWTVLGGSIAIEAMVLMESWSESWAMAVQTWPPY